MQIGLHNKSALKIRRSWEVKIIHILYYWQVSSDFILKRLYSNGLEVDESHSVVNGGKSVRTPSCFYSNLYPEVPVGQSSHRTNPILKVLSSLCLSPLGPVPCLSQIGVIPQPFVLGQDPCALLQRARDGSDKCVLRTLLVSWGCCKNYHKPGDLKQQKLILSQFQMPEKSKI